MKTQTFKSIATLIVAAGMLSSTVFAGPGPKGALVDSQKTQPIAATIAVMPRAHANHFETAETASTPSAPRLVYSAHGGVTLR